MTIRFEIRHESLTLKALTEKYRELRIPLWQRGAAWGTEQTHRFCKAVADMKACPGGIVLIERMRGGADDARTAVIADGQQRLRTLSSLLALNSDNPQLRLLDALDENDAGASVPIDADAKLDPQAVRMVVTTIKISAPASEDAQAIRRHEREAVEFSVRLFERLNRQRMNLLPVDRLKSNIIAALRDRKDGMDPADFDECWERLRAAVWINGLTKAQWDALRSGQSGAVSGLRLPRTERRLKSQKASLMRLLICADVLTEHADVDEIDGLGSQNLEELRWRFDKRFDPKGWNRLAPFCGTVRRIADVLTESRALLLTRGSDEDEAALRDSVEGREKLGRLLWLECLLSTAESPWIGSRPFLLILRELIREGEGSLEDRCGNAVRATETWLARRLASEEGGAVTARDWFLYRAFWLRDEESAAIRRAMAAAMAAVAHERSEASCWSCGGDLFGKIAGEMEARFGRFDGNFPSRGGGSEVDHWIPRERADDKYADRLLEKQRQTLLEMNCLRAHISGGLNQSWRNADPAAKASDLFNNSEKAEACWPTLLFMAVLTDVFGDRFPTGSDLKGLADFAEGLASFWEKFLSCQLSVESTKGSGVPNAER